MNQSNRFKEVINALLAETNFSIDDLREQIFFRRDATVIIPDKEKCILYGLKYGDRLISDDDKLTAIAIGVEDSNLWFQLETYSDNGKLSFWQTFTNYSDLYKINYKHTYENVVPQYITHYELYFMLHTMHQYNYFKEVEVKQLTFPVSFTLFLPLKTLLSNTETEIMETESCSISQLPLDLITDIFEFCSPIDAFNSTFVCRDWYKKIRQCRIWEKYCKHSKIKYNQAILTHDYDGDEVKYYFCYGIVRKLDFSIEKLEDVRALCDKKYYLGGLYWSFTAHSNSIYFRVEPLIRFNIASYLKLPIHVKINNSSETKEMVFIYDCMSSIKILSLDTFVPLKCTITVELHRSLISLMQSAII